MYEKIQWDEEFEAELLKAMKHDMGRGLLEDLPDMRLKSVADDLLTAKRAMVITGFPVLCEDGCWGETDGPPGAVNLAAALSACGCKIWLVTDRPSYPMVVAAAAYRVPEAEVICIEGRQSAALAAELLDRIQPTHVISLERPGMSDDGHYYNMRGDRIDDMVTDTEPFFREGRQWGAHTLGIGDGGNELGMGTYHSQIVKYVSSGTLICAEQRADWALASGISNWWGWGIAAMLSVRTKRMLLPTPEQETELLRRIVAVGAVDGCTRRHELTVDSMGLEDYLNILREVRSATIEEIRKIHWRLR